MIDLSSFDTVSAANAGATMELLHPATKTPLRQENGEPITITVAGMDSDVFRKAQRGATNRRLAQRGKVKLNAEELEAESIETLAACTLGWSGIVVAGQPLPFDRANAVKLYTTLPWVREQLDEFVADRANYLGN